MKPVRATIAARPLRRKGDRGKHFARPPHARTADALAARVRQRLVERRSGSRIVEANQPRPQRNQGEPWARTRQGRRAPRALGRSAEARLLGDLRHADRCLWRGRKRPSRGLGLGERPAAARRGSAGRLHPRPHQRPEDECERRSVLRPERGDRAWIVEARAEGVRPTPRSLWRRMPTWRPGS